MLLMQPAAGGESCGAVFFYHFIRKKVSVMMEVRCENCGRLLGYFEGKGSIKCPRSRCRHMNVFDTRSFPMDKRLERR